MCVRVSMKERVLTRGQRDEVHSNAQIDELKYIDRLDEGVHKQRQGIQKKAQGQCEEAKQWKTRTQ